VRASLRDLRHLRLSSGELSSEVRDDLVLRRQTRELRVGMVLSDTGAMGQQMSRGGSSLCSYSRLMPFATTAASFFRAASELGREGPRPAS
jgi:hypothetical protein